MNESQYSFGDDALQKKFYDNIVESYSEEEKRNIYFTDQNGIEGLNSLTMVKLH